MKYQAIIFDLFGTLTYHTSHQAYREMVLTMASILEAPGEDLVRLWLDSGNLRVSGKIGTEEHVKLLTGIRRLYTVLHLNWWSRYKPLHGDRLGASHHRPGPITWEVAPTGRIGPEARCALTRIHRCGAALGLEQGVRAVGRDGPRSIPINGAGGGLWLELVAPMAVLGSGAGAGSAGQHAREDNRGPGRCDSVGWLSSLVDVSGAVGAVRQAMAGLAIEPGRE